MREIILGPPGTGKTTRLLGLVEQELESGTHPDRIAYVSFTRQAAQEAVQRACTKFNLSARDLPYFRTLHSLCFHTLGMTRADVMEGPRVREFSDWIGLKMSENRSMDDSTMFGFTTGDRAMFMENLSRVTMTPLRQLYDQNPDGLPWRMVEKVQRGLVEFKKAQHVLDFTDMLQQFVDGGWSPPLDVVFVDEAQDLSALQWEVVGQIARGARRVVVAGDDDQAIYRWAGAAVEKFLSLEGSVEVLGQSWRVTPEVQTLAQEIVGRVRDRRPKKWAPAQHEGSLQRAGELMTVDLSGDDVLVLGRNVFALRQAAAQIRREGLLYSLRGSPSVPPTLAAAIRAWESLRRGRQVSAEDCRKIYQLMSSGEGFRRGYKQLPGVGEEEMLSLDWLRENGGLLTSEPWYLALDRAPKDDIGYIRTALMNGEDLSKPRIRLSTIHGSKGGEADHVVLLPDMARRTYNEMLDRPEDEARVWYVGVTRSKRKLTVTKARDKLHYEI